MHKELLQRIEKFAIQTLMFSKKLHKDIEAQNLRSQIAKSVSSISLNYAESEGSESLKDFIHKLSIVLKELRETKSNLTLIEGAGLTS